MSQEPLVCSAVIERLIDGETPSSDPRLADHVGSCLPCFRTASDLRGLPGLRKQLVEARDDGADAADPGAAFWAAFPAQVATAWTKQREEQRGGAAAVAAAPRRRRSAIGDRVSAWLRLPLPAAFAGAVCAVSAVLVITQVAPWRRGASGVAKTVGDTTAATEELVVAAKEPASGLDESLKDLDVAGLQRLQSGLSRSLDQGLAAELPARAAVDADDHAPGNPTALSEEFDELNEAGLALLAENLGESI